MTTISINVLNKAPHILRTDRETQAATLNGKPHLTFLGKSPSTLPTVLPMPRVILTVPVLGSTQTLRTVVPFLPTLSLASQEEVLSDISVILCRCISELLGPVCNITLLNREVDDKWFRVATGIATLILSMGRRLSILVVDLWPRLPNVPRRLRIANLKPVSPVGLVYTRTVQQWSLTPETCFIFGTW